MALSHYINCSSSKEWFSYTFHGTYREKKTMGIFDFSIMLEKRDSIFRLPKFEKVVPNEGDVEYFFVDIDN